MQTEWIALESIESGERKRPLDMAHVTHLSNSIKEIGLQTPITVMARRDEDGWRSILVAGAHRLEALRLLGKDGADCFVLADDQDAADLWEIDENFARAELTDAQRADHHVRRAAILERRGITAPFSSAAGRPKKTENFSKYAPLAAADLGVDERTVRNDLRRGTNIDADVLAEVAGTDLDKGVVLDELARTPKPDQRAKLAEITLRRQEAEQARKAAERVNKDTDRVISLTDAEQFADWLHARTDLAELPTIISWLEGTKAKDVIAALRRQAA